MTKLATTFLVLFLATAPLLAQPAPPLPPGPGGGPAGPGFPGPGPCLADGPGTAPLLDRLDLSDAQRAKIDDLRDKGLQERLQIRKELMRLRNELQGEMLKDNPDADRVSRLARKIGDLRTDLQVSRLRQRLAVRKILTPEQRDRLLMMHGTRLGGRRGGCAGGGPRAGLGPRFPNGFRPGPRAGW